MTVLVDADACPVVQIVERVAKEYAIRVILLCDTNHVLDSAYLRNRENTLLFPLPAVFSSIFSL